jgi:HAD domain in Swiss Army Knife RNA repair proteins
MKILFLDFDGVLNSTEFCRRVSQPGIIGLDRLAILKVNEIIRRTDCKIVVSSVHRYGKTVPELQRRLSRLGLVSKTIIDKTPEPRDGRERGLEIQEWLDFGRWAYAARVKISPEIKSFVILDDDQDMAHLRHRLVQTSFEFGLEDHHVESCVEMLNAK